MSKNIIYKDGLQRLLNNHSKNKYIKRLYPGILQIVKRNAEFIPLYTFGNKRKGSSIDSCTICRLNIKKDTPVYEESKPFMSSIEYEPVYTILDISYIDYHLKSIKKLYSTREYLDDMQYELNKLAKEYNINSQIDGYQTDIDYYMFFNKN